MKDKLNIEYKPNNFISMDIGKNDDGSFHFAGVDIKPNETYIDAVCRTTPARQRALMGLSLKIVSLRLKKTNGKYVDENEEINAINELNRLKNMTDEEYDLEVLRRESKQNKQNYIVDTILAEENLSINENSFNTIGVNIKNKDGNYKSTNEVLSDLAKKWAEI